MPERSDDSSALFDRLCGQVRALGASPPALAWVVQAVRWGILSVDEARGLPARPLYPNRSLLGEIARYLDAPTARAELARCKDDERLLRAELLARLLVLGEQPFVAAYVSERSMDEQATLLAHLLPAHPPDRVLGSAFPPLKEALVAAARERAAGGWTELLFTILPLLTTPERAALVEWAVADPAVLRGLGDEEVIPLAAAGFGRRAVERAARVEGAYPRAIALNHVAAIMPSDHPDREILARVQLELLKLPRSSQPYRMWRNQILDVPVPAALHGEVRAVLDAWPPGERAVALLAWAEHTPELREEAFAALDRLSPPAVTLGTLLHFDLLPEHTRGAAFARGRALALAWEARGEEPADHWAIRLFHENRTLDAAGLWALVAKHAPDRAAAHEALAHAETCRKRAAHAQALHLATAAARALPAGEMRRRAVSEVAEGAFALPELENRLARLGALGEELSDEHRARWVALLHRCVEAESPQDWLERVLGELPALPAADRDALFSACVERVRCSADEERPGALLALAEHAEGDLRQELLALALSEIAAGPPVGSYPLFRCLRAEDPRILHERLAGLLDHLRPEMDRAYLLSCLAASQPATMRGETITRALAAWEAQGLIKFDISVIPTENLWAVIELPGAERILALCLARPGDEGTEECLSRILGHLARLGAEASRLVTHLAALQTPCLRTDALVDLAAYLSPAEIAAQIHAVIAAAVTGEDVRLQEVFDVVALLPRLDEAPRVEVLDVLERHLREAPEILDGVDYDVLFDRLLSLGEHARAERWLSLAVPSDSAVEGHLKLAARLPGDAPRRAELVARAEEMSEQLPERDQSYLYIEAQGNEALLSQAWARRRIDRALSEDRVTLGDLEPWMPIARRALGDELLARFVSFLAALDRGGAPA